jgi:Na+/melibiose symporter-like transporter
MAARKHPRLWTPAVAVLAGTAIAVAVGINQSWWSALISELVALAWAVSLYVIGGRDTDLGAVVGAQEDERQELVKLRAARLCLAVVVVAVVVGCLIAAATKHAIWPFQAVAVVIGISYFYGLWLYGDDRDETDRADRAHQGTEDGF